MKISLENRVAVVTGGAGGLGLAVVKALRQAGAQVAVWDMNETRISAAAAELADVGVIFLTCDQTDLAHVERACAATVERFGKIDILVNNAGIVGPAALMWEGDPRAWAKVIEVNLIGQYHCSRVVVPQMIACGYGRIVNVASVAGKDGNATMTHYSASKAGIIGMTKALAKEVASHGILVNAVTPSIFRSELIDSVPADINAQLIAKVPLGRVGEPEEIATLITFLSSDATSFSTGAVFDISGGRSSY